MCQGLENIVVAAELLSHRSDIVFLFVGDGVKRRELQQMIEARNIGNVRFLGYQPASNLSEILSAADIHLVPLDPRVSRFLMPSKLYGVLASGTPGDCNCREVVRAHRTSLIRRRWVRSRTQ